MRRLAAFCAAILALVCALPAAAATVTGIGTNNSAGQAALAITLTSPVAAGDTVVVAVSQSTNGTVPSSVTDTLGQTYTCGTKFATSTTTADGNYCWKTNSGALSIGNTITVNFSNTSTAQTIAAADVTGVNTFDSPQGSPQSGNTTAGGAISPAPSITPSTSGTEVIFGLLVSTGSTTATNASPLTQLYNSTTGPNFLWSYEVVNSTSPVTWAPTTSTAARPYGTGMIAFKNVVSANNCRHGLLMMGVGTTC